MGMGGNEIEKDISAQLYLTWRFWRCACLPNMGFLYVKA